MEAIKILVIGLLGTIMCTAGLIGLGVPPEILFEIGKTVASILAVAGGLFLLTTSIIIIFEP